MGAGIGSVAVTGVAVCFLFWFFSINICSAFDMVGLKN